DLIAQTEEDQDEKRSEGELYETNLAIYGGGTDLILSDLEHIQFSEQQNVPEPPGPPEPPEVPSEFGAPETITAPAPYSVGSDTQIITSGPPRIVSNGVTNYGKIYRTTPLDGIRSLWFFRSTRAFDIASG